LVDFDGDGRLDLLSGSHCCDGGGFHLFRRKGDGSWGPRQHFQVTPPLKVRILGGGFVSAADWDGDGVPDLLGVAAQRGIVVALGPFKEGKPITISREMDFKPNDWVIGFAVADWDRDGKPDLLVHQANPETGTAGIYWCRNLGGPGLTKLAEGKILLELRPQMHVLAFCVCDWSDGKPGLIVTGLPGGPQGKGEWRRSVWLYPRE
jgi:FG-GAP-like repeat